VRQAFVVVVAVTVAVSGCLRSWRFRRLGDMTTRERLHRLVDGLSDDQAAEALALLESQLGDEPRPAALPEFFGMLHSGKGDLAARSEEILRAEFGRR
jgi:hypothetical protein